MSIDFWEIFKIVFLTEEISDHYPIFCVMDCKIKKFQSEFQIPTRKFTESKKYLFIEDLKARLDHSFEQHTSDPGISLERLVHVIRSSIINTFPVVELSKTKRKRFRNPWITPGILKSIDHRNALLKKIYYLKKSRC